MTKRRRSKVGEAFESLSGSVTKLIQRSQNKDAVAIHLKLNELVAAMEGASNRLIEVEALTERELVALGRHYLELATLAGHDTDLTKSHLVEEARNRHTSKRRGQG
jgi:low affinity Fe/Cu permease